MDSVLILNTEINVTSVDEISELLQTKDLKTIANCNANTLVRCYKNSILQNKINSLDVRTPDGFPVAKASRFLYKNNQERVDGYKLFHETIKKGLKNNRSHYFFGSDEETVNNLKKNLIKLYPEINISGYTCPPVLDYEELTEDKWVDDLKNKHPDIVWVSLGFPKQEEFIELMAKKIKIKSNFVGIGGVFHWVAGSVIKAPEILANIGLEWVFRLIQEPRRLFKRYLVDNFLFIIYIIKQIIEKKDKQS